jgi:hypothetical protein
MKSKQTPHYKLPKKPKIHTKALYQYTIIKTLTQTQHPMPTKIKQKTLKRLHQKNNKTPKCPKTYQNRQRKKTYNIKNTQKDTQKYYNHIISKPCDNKKNPIRPITKTHTKNKPNKQKRNHLKYFYLKTNTNKYKYTMQTFFPQIQSTYSQYHKNLKLYLQLVCKHQIKNKLKDENAYIEAPTSTIGKINNNLTIKKCKKMPCYTFFNKKTILQCGDIERNPGPKLSFLLNYPQEYHNKQKTYFYNKTTQLKPEYNHILELFKPYLKCTQITTTNQHLAQFCVNNNICLESYLFYAILITLAATPIRSNQLITENSTQWTTNLI